jgi:hypothetical protein
MTAHRAVRRIGARTHIEAEMTAHRAERRRGARTRIEAETTAHRAVRRRGARTRVEAEMTARRAVRRRGARTRTTTVPRIEAEVNSASSREARGARTHIEAEMTAHRDVLTVVDHTSEQGMPSPGRGHEHDSLCITLCGGEAPSRTGQRTERRGAAARDTQRCARTSSTAHRRERISWKTDARSKTRADREEPTPHDARWSSHNERLDRLDDQRSTEGGVQQGAKE